MISYKDNHDLLDICKLTPVIPVLVVDDTAKAVPLAKALIGGGLRVLEVTLRTENALDVIKEMAAGTTEGIIGAGTLLSKEDVYAAKNAGASFGVSPGITDQILKACAEVKLPLLPGAATPSEVMNLLAKGYSVQKFFPAESNGGVAALKSMLGPIPEVSFCPTGGVTSTNALGYLSLKNVPCVGGSWIAPEKKLKLLIGRQ
jgi:2-dehydro-3-deoxyphosphogluconate aldolase/(4S)-4-hydroxy-2-oxoglutarate aldolase